MNGERILSEWECQCCKKDCFIDPKDYYMIQSDLWNKTAEKPEGMLCMDCLEEKLGRKLEAKDILPCWVTTYYNQYTIKILNDGQING